MGGRRHNLLDRTRLKRDIRWGAGVASLYAGVWTAGGLVVGTIVGGELAKAFGLGRAALLVAFYWFACLFVGVVAGVLRPLTVRYWGALLVAMVAGLPLVPGAVALLIAPEDWQRDLIPVSVVVYCICVPLYSAVVWQSWRDKG